jgi:PhoH-like ATPase
MKMFERIVVLDTNVIIDDPTLFNNFKNTLIVLPFICVNELDGLKNNDEVHVRSQVRKGSNILDAITEHEAEIMPLPNNSFLLIETICEDDLDSPEKQKNDGKIISVAMRYAKLLKDLHHGDEIPTKLVKESKGKKFGVSISDIFVERLENVEKVELLSNDTDVRVLARTFQKSLRLPLKSYKYTATKESLDDMETGIQNMIVPTDVILTCRKEGRVSIDLDFLNGEHIIFVDEANFSHSLLGYYDSVHKEVRPINDYKKGEPIWKVPSGDAVRPIDARQSFLAHDLLDTNKNLHFVLSKVAGAGKNFITYACALRMLKMGEYDRLIVIKPMVEPDGQKTGFLKGTKEEKIAPWFDSFKDTMEELTSEYQGLDEEIGAKIELDIVTHMRGRSIPRAIVVIDEAQNFSPHAIKTLLTRAGTDTKYILCGDLTQIDNPRLDAYNNGLRVWAERSRSKDNSYVDGTYIMLESNFRSELSAWASSFY